MDFVIHPACTHHRPGRLHPGERSLEADICLEAGLSTSSEGGSRRVGLDQDGKRARDLKNPSPSLDLHDILNDLERIVEATIIQSKAGIRQSVLEMALKGVA